MFQGRELTRKLYRDSVLINNFFKEQVTNAMDQVATELELPRKTKFSQYFVLCELYYTRQTTLTELSDAIDVTMPNVSNTVNELIGLGLAERKADSSDRRKTIISITELGLTYSKKIIPLCVEIFDTVFYDKKQSQQIVEYYEETLKRIDVFQNRG